MCCSLSHPLLADGLQWLALSLYDVASIRIRAFTFYFVEISFC